jgi:hypothetical protein
MKFLHNKKFLVFAILLLFFFSTSPRIISAKEIKNDSSSVNTLSKAMVQIICKKQEKDISNVILGSGVIISKKGVVLTGAHVAQFFLLENLGYECIVRMEDNNLSTFKAKPLYISEKWIENNASLIDSENPMGSGKNDYALLLITKATNPGTKLYKFPFISPEINLKTKENEKQITLAGYPIDAGYYSSKEKTKLKVDKAFIERFITFEEEARDMIATEDTYLAYGGVSGGGIFKENKIIGLIVTKSSNKNENVLNGLTINYIDRTLEEETGDNLDDYLSGNLEKIARKFDSKIAPKLEKILKNNF